MEIDYQCNALGLSCSYDLDGIIGKRPHNFHLDFYLVANSKFREGREYLFYRNPILGENPVTPANLKELSHLYSCPVALACLSTS